MAEALFFNVTTERDLLVNQVTEEFLSLANFQRAWAKVAENKGSPGIDEQTIDDFASNLNANILNLRNEVANSTYQPLPCKQVLIPKKKGNWRELKIPAVRDRIVQQALLNVLAPLMEKIFSSANYAYRVNLSYLNAVEEVARWRDLGYHWVLDADISQFFDRIDHQILLQQVRKYLDHPGILCLIKAWISVGALTERGVVKATRGIPQGAVVSPLLANIYLDEFDRLIPTPERKLVRYADDFLVLARSKEEIVAAYREVERTLQSLRLELHSGKTQITNFDQGFRFLGHGFLGNAIFPVDTPKTEGRTSKKKVHHQKQNKQSQRKLR